MNSLDSSRPRLLLRVLFLPRSLLSLEAKTSRTSRGDEGASSPASSSAERWTEGETLESKFICVYCAAFLVENKEKLHLNQAFIFPTPKRGNETIREPIYQIKWSENLARNSIFSDALAIVMRNAIYHKH